MDNHARKAHALEAIHDTLTTHYIGIRFTFKQFKDMYYHNYKYSSPIIADSTLRKYLESFEAIQKFNEGGRVYYENFNFARPARLYKSLSKYYSIAGLLESDEFILTRDIENFLMSDMIITRDALYKSLQYINFFELARGSVYGARYTLQEIGYRVI